MVAAAGAGLHPTLDAAAAAMQQGGTLRHPDPGAAARIDRDLTAFSAMLRHRGELEAIATPRPPLPGPTA